LKGKVMNKIKGLTKLFLGTAATIPIAGCSLGVVADAEKVIQSDRSDTDKLVDVSEQPLSRKTTGPVKIIDDIFLGNQAESRINGEPLPRSVERDGVVLYAAEPMGIIDVSNIIKSVTDIPVKLDADVLQGDADRGPAPGDVPSAVDSTNITAQGGVQGITPEQDLQDPTVNGSGGASRALNPDETMIVNFEGKLSDFLNRVSTRFQINWEYKNREIRFFRQEQKTFLVKVMSSDMEASMEIGSGSGENAFGSSTQQTTTQLQANIWDEIIESVGGFAGPNGNVVASKSTGTISISANSSNMRRIERYIAEQNERFAQQISVNVKVFNVATTDSDQYATDLNLVWAGTNNWMAGFTKVATGGIEGAGQGNWQLLKPNSDYAGTNGIVEALSQKGDVSVVTTANATTLNNVPTPIQVGNTRGYIKSFSAGEETEEGSSGPTVEDGSVTTGFNMQVIPRVMSNSIIGLQYNINISELIGPDDGFNRFNVGEGFIQLPNVNTRAFTQQVMIPNGNTLVLSGFEQTKSNVSKSGVGSADNWLTGGSNTGSMERETMVIMITPTIIETDGIIEEL
jgi:type IVB pilus formation R64 PilN family outer membrane protein